MELQLQKWGNSNGVRIPSSFLKSLGIKTQDKIEMTLENDKIVITKKIDRTISLEERIKNYKGDNIIEDYDWGKPEGREIW